VAAIYFTDRRKVNNLFIGERIILFHKKQAIKNSFTDDCAKFFAGVEG